MNAKLKKVKPSTCTRAHPSLTKAHQNCKHIHTYILTYIHTYYICWYIHTYIRTNVHTYIHPYIHQYLIEYAHIELAIAELLQELFTSTLMLERHNVLWVVMFKVGFTSTWHPQYRGALLARGPVRRGSRRSGGKCDWMLWLNVLEVQSAKHTHTHTHTWWRK